MGKSAKGIDGFVTTVKESTDVNWADLTDRPTIPAAQVQSDWNSGSGLGEILNKPTIPSNTNQLTNGNGFITSSSLTWDNVTGKPTIPGNNNQLVNGSGYITLSDVTWTNTAGKPNFANVATSGSYSDLTNKPTFPAKTIVRAQKTYPSGSWTFSTISGSGTAIYVNNGTSIGLLSNEYIVFTLTGFTQMPSLANTLNMATVSNGGYSNAGFINIGNNMTLFQTTSGSLSVLSPGNPNVLTNFDPAIHRFALQASNLATSFANTDMYFEFRE